MKHVAPIPAQAPSPLLRSACSVGPGPARLLTVLILAVGAALLHPQHAQAHPLQRHPAFRPCRGSRCALSPHYGASGHYGLAHGGYLGRLKHLPRPRRAELRRLGAQPPFTSGLAAPPPSFSASFNKYSRYSSLKASRSSVDWRSAKVLSPIQNQGNCSASWAFATTAAVEAANAIRNGASSLVKLSEQQLLACQNGKGCAGGWPEAALAYAVHNGGLDSAADYPYTPLDTNCSSMKEKQSVAGIGGYERLPTQDETRLMRALQYQPVIVYVDAHSASFQAYKGGVFTYSSCGNSPNHAVLAVGYGTTTKKPIQNYWILRNSWGTGWGESGYMRLIRTGPGNGLCGVLVLPPVYPTLSSAGGGGGSLCTPNPCGVGTCVAYPRLSLYTCNCSPQDGVVSVTNSDATQTCVPVDQCGAVPFNPCGAGTCINDMAGGYTCACSDAFLLGYAADGRPTCVPGGQGGGTQSYIIQPRDFCLKIAIMFGISLQVFYDLNPAIVCNNLQPGQIVVVSPGVPTCYRWYQWQQTDFCTRVLLRFNISGPAFLALNNNLSCTAVPPGLQVCVAGPVADNGTSLGSPGRCSVTRIVGAKDTCSTISSAYGLPLSYLQSLNPWLICAKLQPGATICVGAKFAAPFCSAFYRIRQGDLCWVQYQRAGITQAQFNALNPGINCDHLQIGQRICVKGL